MKARLLLFALFLTTTIFLHAAELSTIHEAAITGNLPAVQQFLDQDSSLVNLRDKDGNTPLHLAIPMPTLTILLIARQGASQSHIDSINREESLRAEMFQKRVAVVRLLLDRGARINEQNNLGYTPLHEAASRATKDFFVRLLINHGASVNLRTNSGHTPADLAISSYWDVTRKVANMLRHYAACLTFCEVLHSKLGAQSPANILPQYAVQAILQHLQPSDFAKSNHPKQ